MKDGEDSKRKTYLALCISPTIANLDLDKLSSMKNVEVQQRTPIRVLHRRPNATRIRTIYEMRVDPVSAENLAHFGADSADQAAAAAAAAQIFRLKLTTQAGTYVKEFVHGDFGRTSPNLREILGVPDLDIIALDVLVNIKFALWTMVLASP